MTPERPFVDQLLAGFGFDLDHFQLQAVDALDEGQSVLVSAPTGSGKTAVAEYAVADALDRGLRAFYTAPIKALSNQKFSDLRARYGPGRVGLLTGDNSIDGDAPVVVMTTEVLRNMIYAGRDLDDLAVVVLDEVHYLQDSFRGPVWEEVIIHLPDHVQLVCLSATVSNAADIADWLETVRGPTAVVVESRRPVELANTYLVGDRGGERLRLLDTLLDGRANPEGSRFDRSTPVDGGRRRRGRGAPTRSGRWYTPQRLEVLDLLEDRDLLPAIVFVFSRAGCDDAVRQCVDAGIRLTDHEQRARIRAIADRYLAALSAADQEALGADRWLAGLEAGIASHHAGHVPPFKEAVETAFAQGLVKLVFATETLALGVNMPARAVVVERLTKFNGERREQLTPAEYTQLTGRAGRRGIDTHGTAVVLWSPFVPFGSVAALAGSRSFELRSAFRPTYNMAANLIRGHTPEDASRLIDLSLAQYQADAAVVAIQGRLTRRRSLLAELEDGARCERGDVADYVATLGARPTPSRQQLEQAVAQLRPGDVLVLDDDRSLGVLSVASRRGGATRLKGVTDDRQVVVLDAGDFDQVPRVRGHLSLPEPYRPDDSGFRAEVARLVGEQDWVGPRAARGSPARADHPVAACPDVERHVRSHHRAARVRGEVRDLERQVAKRSNTLQDHFRRVLDVLGHFGYRDGWVLTERGSLLVGIYHEADLVVAEALATGVLDDLDASSLSAVLSAVVYEHRSKGPPPRPRYPTAGVRERLARLDRIVASVRSAEEDARLPLSREAEHGFGVLAHAWCSGASLADLLEETDLDLTGGDFVRTMRQVVDLVRQLAQVAPVAATRAAATDATRRLQRGVVAASLDVDDARDAPGGPA